ncbi:MAG: MBL fold metallo-hydrolase, partial [Lachnospiraceae bacterium]
MRLCSIASGSSGNCIYIGTEHTHILIDAGISGKRIEEGLNQIGLTTAEMQGILVTHEHSDHIKGLGVIGRKYGIPIYATGGTCQAICNSKSTGQLDKSLFHEVEYDNDITIGELKVHPFRVSHDAQQPTAYVTRYKEQTIGVATDMGVYDEYTVENLQGLDVLLLEAN